MSIIGVFYFFCNTEPYLTAARHQHTQRLFVFQCDLFFNLLASHPTPPSLHLVSSLELSHKPRTYTCRPPCQAVIAPPLHHPPIMIMLPPPSLPPLLPLLQLLPPLPLP